MTQPVNYGTRFVQASRICHEMTKAEAIDILQSVATTLWVRRAMDTAQVAGAFICTVDKSFEWPVVALWLAHGSRKRTVILWLDPHADPPKWKISARANADLPKHALPRVPEIGGNTNDGILLGTYESMEKDTHEPYRVVWTGLQAQEITTPQTGFLLA